MKLKEQINRFLRQGDAPSFDESEKVNDVVHKRNKTIAAIGIGVGALGYVVYHQYQVITHPSVKTMKAEFVSSVPKADFDSDLTKSYLQKVQSKLAVMDKQLNEQTKNNQQYVEVNDALSQKVKSLTDSISTLKHSVQSLNAHLAEEKDSPASPPATTSHDVPSAQSVQKQSMGEQSQHSVSQSWSDDAVAYNNTPRYADNPGIKSAPQKTMTAAESEGGNAVSDVAGIESFKFASKKKPHTPENYVPAGAFVTAVMTGGADANAGVNGTADTAPVTFRAINNGFLPNGKKSHLKDCFFTASAYGEISSSRGIIRTDHMSCTLPNNEILDVPVQATAFNFGKNGVRGTPVMRNGKIVEMAGVSGLFTGLGDTAKNLSTTQSVSPLGTTTTINPSDALANLTGSSLEAVGSKLSDYYIKLAEQYHPVIELNAGAVVNIVFLQGFSLDPNVAPTKTQHTNANVQQVVQLPDAIKSKMKNVFAPPSK